MKHSLCTPPVKVCTKASLPAKVHFELTDSMGILMAAVIWFKLHAGEGG